VGVGQHTFRAMKICSNRFKDSERGVHKSKNSLTYTLSNSLKNSQQGLPPLPRVPRRTTQSVAGLT
jgi:hypothetical protein